MYLLSDRKREALKKYLGSKNQRGIYEDILWKKVRRYQKIFSYIPGVQALCICNSLAMNACHPESDIDLFVITEKNRLWTTRISLTLLTTLLGIRKTAKKHKGQFCLSFFISIDEGSFYDIAIERDMYLSYWLETLIPIVNKHNAFERFMQTNFSESPSPLNLLSFGGEEGYQEGRTWVLKILGDTLEQLLKKIFLPKTLRHYEKLGKPFGIVITDTMLKFHNHDKRKKIRDTLI